LCHIKDGLVGPHEYPDMLEDLMNRTFAFRVKWQPGWGGQASVLNVKDSKELVAKIQEHLPVAEVYTILSYWHLHTTLHIFSKRGYYQYIILLYILFLEFMQTSWCHWNYWWGCCNLGWLTSTSGFIATFIKLFSISDFCCLPPQSHCVMHSQYFSDLKLLLNNYRALQRMIFKILIAWMIPFCQLYEIYLPLLFSVFIQHI
jgi:hypothetical protein